MYCTVGTSYKMGSNGAACEIGKKKRGRRVLSQISSSPTECFLGEDGNDSRKSKQEQTLFKDLLQGICNKNNKFLLYYSQRRSLFILKSWW